MTMGAMRSLFTLCLFLTACATVPQRPSRPAYAWATFDRAAITASGTSGLADRARHRRLTIDDPVRIASISKLVVALGVMRLVEEGKLDLDRDVSDYLGWSLRNPAFPDQPISLRLLLSHRSSLTDGIDYAIPLGTGLRTALASPAAFDSTHRPGTWFHYTNLNFPVIASAMERASGERFDRLMERLVLRPLGLDACFNWTTCSHADLARAVVLYDAAGHAIRDDLGGLPPACPVLAPAGAPCDLAAIGRLLMNRGMHDGHRFLSEASVRAMITKAWTYDGSNGDSEGGFYCAYGLAVQHLPGPGDICHDDLFNAEWGMIGHAGDAYGVRSGLWVDMENGIGIAFFATGNGDDPPRGRSAYRSIEEQLARHLGRSGP
jgi:CubicO group peptidase (beta-lactamase class C family)